MFRKQFLVVIINFVIFLLILFGLVYFIGINKIENIKMESIFAAIVTIFVFGVGLFVKIIEDKLKQRKKDIQLKKIFNVNLRNINYGLKLQIDFCKNVVKTLNSPNSENIKFSSYTELDYFEINNLSSEDLYRIFIDNLKGDEDKKIETLENLRKHLRFIENSKDNLITNFEKLYKSTLNYADEVVKGMKDLGEFFNNEATSLLNSKSGPEKDEWFMHFSTVLLKIQFLLKTSDDTFTDFEKIEKEIIPIILEFEQEHMEDKRTPIVTSIFNEGITAIFQRKDALRSLIDLVTFYKEKYKEAQKVIESTLVIYDNHKSELVKAT